MLNRAAPAPFECVATVDLGRLLPLGRAFRPTLCLSDTHLLAEETDFCADIPDQVLTLLEWYGDYQLFMLGDLTESLLYSPQQITTLKHNHRLHSVLSELRFRPVVRVIPGNHDARVVAFLRKYLGSDRVFVGGFRVGRLVFVHGHEYGLDASPMAEQYTGMVPVGGILNSFGVRPRVGIATNVEIAALYTPLRLFPIFGHTHDPALAPEFANAGCFLPGAASFLTIVGTTMSLWRDVS